MDKQLAEYFLFYQGKKVSLGTVVVSDSKDDDDMFVEFIGENPLVLFEKIDQSLQEVILPEGLGQFIATLKSSEFDINNIDGLEEMLPDLLGDLVSDGFQILSNYQGEVSILACEESDEDGDIVGRSSTLAFIGIEID